MLTPGQIPKRKVCHHQVIFDVKLNQNSVKYMFSIPHQTKLSRFGFYTLYM